MSDNVPPELVYITKYYDRGTWLMEVTDWVPEELLTNVFTPSPYTPYVRGDCVELEWREMDTAPRDGTKFLVWWPFWSDTPEVAWFDKEFGIWDSHCALFCNPCTTEGPLCWQPLPEPPEERDNG